MILLHALVVLLLWPYRNTPVSPHLIPKSQAKQSETLWWNPKRSNKRVNRKTECFLFFYVGKVKLPWESTAAAHSKWKKQDRQSFSVSARKFDKTFSWSIKMNSELKILRPPPSRHAVRPTRCRRFPLLFCGSVKKELSSLILIELQILPFLFMRNLIKRAEKWEGAHPCGQESE